MEREISEQGPRLGPYSDLGETLRLAPLSRPVEAAEQELLSQGLSDPTAHCPTHPLLLLLLQATHSHIHTPECRGTDKQVQ